MKRPIARFTIVCGWVLILLLTATGQGGCDTGSESGILPCIPDLQHAREALAQRRGARFIAFLQKTGDKYIRNGDYECLYDMVKFLDGSSPNLQEYRYLLLYRIIAQMGQKRFVEAHLDYDWLVNALGMLGETGRAAAIWEEAQQVFAGQPEMLATVRAAAERVGVAE